MRVRAWTLAAAFVVRSVLPSAAQDLTSEPGPEEQRAHPVTKAYPIPRLTLTVTPSYPPEAAAISATGVVRIRATLDALGRVSELRTFAAPPLVFPGVPASGDALRAAAEALQRAVADAVRQWQYDAPARAPISFTIAVAFTQGTDPSISHDSSPPPAGRVRALRLSPSVPVPPSDDGWASGALRVGGDVRQPRRVKNASPVYPLVAREARIQGIVIVDAHVGPDGRVIDARVLRSIPELDQAALDAVRQWEFAPTIVDGAPVAVVMTLAINFSL